MVSATLPPFKGDFGYDEFMQYVVPNIDAVAPIIRWAQIDNGKDGPCGEGGNPACDFATLDAELMPYVQAGLGVNLLIAPVSEALTSNIATPKYVFTDAYAAHVGAAPQDRVVCDGWPGGGATFEVVKNGQAAVWNTKTCVT